MPLAVLLMRLGFGWRIRGARRCRREYARILAERRPLLVAANHLTMLDSALIGWGLGSALHHVLRPRGLPWNVPLRSRVERSRARRALAYLTRCVPVPRGGDRSEVAEVLARLSHLLRSGQAVLVFPEGGRSRSGRVDTAAAADGVGRLVRDAGGCRVLCVYLRGDAQRTWSDLPAAGDSFTLTMRLVEPRTQLRGPRASRAIATEVVGHLAELEAEYFAAREDT